MRRKAIIGGIISLVFMYLALRKVDYSDLWTTLQGARWSYLIPNIVLVVGVMFIRAWRWQLILRPIARIPFARVYSSTMIGFMANNVLPARLGEIARAVSLGLKTGISRSATLATIIVERIYDSFVLLAFLWLVFSFSQLSTHTEVARIRYLGWIFLCVNVALVLILILLQFRNASVVRFVERVTRKMSPRVQAVSREITEKFARGLRVHHNWPTTVGVAVSSLVIWIIMGFSNYFVFLALGFHLPWEASFVVLVVVSLMISIPSTAGFVGVYHWATQISLQVYGLSPSEAVAVAIVLHAAQYIPITVLGFYHLRREHLRLRTVDGSQPAPEKPAETGAGVRG
ncbi:MAG: flippase-like domain-containing protein [candidate division Zixibacteria bacterium]|nr:flippase-like domain-containing protein [candidate division Zixibacteria bacterium]